MTLRILLVDDRPSVLSDMPYYFATAPDIEVVGKACSGRAALDWLAHNTCDIVLSDIHMPDMGGIELFDALVTLPNPPLMVAMTAFDEDQTMMKVLARGASGYILKGQPPEHVCAALRTVAAGGTALSPTLVTRLVDKSVRGDRGLTAEVSEELSELDLEILRGIQRGQSNKQMAARLNYSEIYVKKRVSQLFERFGVDSRSELAIATMYLT